MDAEDVIVIPGVDEKLASTTSPMPLIHNSNVSTPGHRLDKDAGSKTVTFDLSE